MPTATYTPITSTTLTSTAASVTFSSLNTLASGMRDLILIIDLKISGTQTVGLRFNGDTLDNYRYVVASGNGSSTFTSNPAAQSAIDLHYNDANAGNSIFIINLFDFSQTDKHKCINWRHDFPAQVTRMGSARWGKTEAITSILISSFGGTYNAGSTFSLYGVIS